ncbi:MAG: hypothetical protein HZB61_07145 [Nitrospirae bacterium]|nr:hypothetical protein [Nitrospirota bacterium]
MIKEILHNARSDDGLFKLLSVAAEYAEIYLLAKKRQKGCDGMGELTTLKEEFRDAVDKVIKYCQEKKYISQEIAYDIDEIADEIQRLLIVS